MTHISDTSRHIFDLFKNVLCSIVKILHKEKSFEEQVANFLATDILEPIQQLAFANQ